jgi:peptidoglycan-associated lipoprotein
MAAETTKVPPAGVNSPPDDLGRIFKMKYWLRGSCAVLAAMTLAACASKPEVTESASSYADRGMVPVAAPFAPGSAQEFIEVIGNTVLFGYDEATLNTKAADALQRQAVWLNTYPNTLLIVEGHADERGTREYNLGLGERRAQAVKEYLLSSGIDAGRVETISYGKERQVCVASGESCWSQNRRGLSVVRDIDAQQAQR